MGRSPTSILTARSTFKCLLFRRDLRHFVAFDVIACEGEDVRGLPLLTRKKRLRRIISKAQSRVMFLDGIEGRGVDLFRLACERDLEGIVAKQKRGTYITDGARTSWIKIKNSGYTQMEGRAELFDRGRVEGVRRKQRVPTSFWHKQREAETRQSLALVKQFLTIPKIDGYPSGPNVASNSGGRTQMNTTTTSTCSGRVGRSGSMSVNIGFLSRWATRPA